MRRRRGRRGQSIVEYLVIVTIIIAAIITIRATVSGNMNSLMQGAANRTSNAAISLNTLRGD